MLKILILDDDPSKTCKISEVLKEVDGILEHMIDLAQDITTGRNRVKNKQYDLLLLDIQIPIRYDQKPLMDGGATFIKDIRKSIRCKIPDMIISVTEYEETFQEANKTLKEITNLYYDMSSEWEESLKTKVSLLIDRKKRSNLTNEYNYDLAVVCALKDPELEQLLKLVKPSQLLEIPGDPSLYYTFTVTNKDKILKCICSSLPKMGQVYSSALAMKMIQNFRPRYLAMSGISGGIKSSVKIGDIVVGETIWNYDSGKYALDGFKQEPHQFQMDSRLKVKLELLKNNRVKLDRITEEWAGNTPDTRLNLHIGPLGCGSSVVASESKLKEIKEQHRKVIGFEMESYGLAVACDLVAEPAPKFIAIKSVCDYGDAEKSDDFQKYASYTSAKALLTLFEDYIDFDD